MARSKNSSICRRVLVGLALVFLLPAAGCSDKSESTQTKTNQKSSDSSKDCRIRYEQAVKAAEEAKARIELDPKPWLERCYLTLGSVDLRGDGRKSRFEAVQYWGTRMGEDILRMTPPGESGQIQLHLVWNSLDMYYPSGLEWSDNATDPNYAPEREFLDTIKYAYGYIAESDILCRTDDPNYAVHFWGKENGHIAEGGLKLRRYKKKPQGFKPDKKPYLEDGNIIYARYRSGLMAYDRENEEYFLVFRVDSQYNSVNALAKAGSWLIIGLWGEGVVAVDLKDYYLKRFPSIKESIGKIDVTNSKIIIDDGRHELDFPIERTGEKIRPYFFGPTGLK